MFIFLTRVKVSAQADSFSVHVWQSVDGDEILAQFCVPPELKSEQYHVHPALLEEAFELVGLCSSVNAAQDEAWVPSKINSLKLHQGSRMMVPEPLEQGSEDQGMWASVCLIDSSAHFQNANLVVYDLSTGGLTLSVEGLGYKLFEPDSTNQVTTSDSY